MRKLTATDPETKSPDFVAENIARLRALFPELLTEGKEGVAVNLDVLKQLVGDKTVTDSEDVARTNLAAILQQHGLQNIRSL